MKVFRYLSVTAFCIACAGLLLMSCEKSSEGEEGGEDVPYYNLKNGLVLQMTFDEGNCQDNSGNGNHGVANKEVSYTSETATMTGKALQLDGTQEQFVNIPYSLLKECRQFTVSAWVKNFGPGVLLSMQSGRMNTPSMYVTSDSKLLVYYNNYYNSATLNTSLVPYQSSGWHFIAVTALKGGELALYIDGKKMDSKEVGNVECDGNKMQIGGNVDGGLDAWADPMIIDNVRVYSRALGGAEIEYLYKFEGGASGQPNPTSTTRGLLGYYTFDDNTLKNSYLPINHGSFEGMVEPDFITDTPNGRGKALNLLSEQFVNFPQNVLKGKRAYSVGMWVKDFGTGALFSTLSGRLNTPSLYVTSDSKLKVYYNNYYNSSVLNTSLESYQSSGWHFIVVTAQQNKEMTLFIDGTKMDSKAVDNVECDGNKMQIGGNADGTLDAWADPMLVDNVRIHSVALTEGEVKAIYNQEKN